jgi:hypothetical protein
MNLEIPTISTANYTTTAIDPGFFVVGNAADAAGMQRYQNALNLFNAQPVKNMEMPMSNRRFIRVIIVDPNENIPLADAVLYDGGEKFTDLTDQELFFESNIQDSLKKHNEKRVKIRDKKIKDREEFLEPARIRDLKMTVVNIASF